MEIRYDAFQSTLLDNCRGWRAKNSSRQTDLERKIKISQWLFGFALIAELVIFSFVLIDASIKPDDNGVWGRSAIDILVALVVAAMAPIATYIASTKQGKMAVFGVLALILIWTASVVGFVSNLGVVETLLKTFGLEEELAINFLRFLFLCLGVVLFSVFTVLAKIAYSIKMRSEEELGFVKKILSIANQADTFDALASEEQRLLEVIEIKTQIFLSNSQENIHRLARGICVARWQADIDALQSPNPYGGTEANMNYQRDRDALTALIDQITTTQQPKHQRSISS